MLRLTTTFVAASLALPAFAILVTPGSPCSTSCGNVLDSTTPDDVVCSHDGYSSGPGQVFEGCVDCELSSGYVNGDETDTQWMLYNVRYAVSYCLFGTPKNEDVISTPCITSKACGPFKDAIEFNKLSTNITGYDYCAIWPVSDPLDLQGCTQCLHAGDQEYLANFITVLHAGCQQQPPGGVPVGIEGDIFSTDNVNATAASAVPTVDPTWFDQGPLTLGAKVGIAFGGFAFILVLIGFFIIWNGKRRRRAFLRTLEAKQGHQGWPSPNQGDMRETPMSQRPLRGGWDDSPMSANTEKNFGRYFSPYSSQYNSPVSGQDGPSMPWPDMRQGNQAAGSAVDPNNPNNPNYHWPQPTNLMDAHVHQAGTEEYEMHEVESAGGSRSVGKQRMYAPDPPVLLHPGYGRNGNVPPRTYALTDEDVKAGTAY